MSTGLEGKEGKKHITRSEHENNPTPLRTKLYEEHAMKGRTTKRGWGWGAVPVSKATVTGSGRGTRYTLGQ